ncbi:hypothetical protein O1611_g4440 [Lasiodiplodia mahajangana]|uniref:Uncharacterized protein n=1 Tax=Lasiodiplodia mahajangana TaxID=1108764 RepID=A0ACC2JNZ2_9PEZI|nr:hypothetical protein O1611_g4440 [Lasiodiplodia mahajangana]
MSPPESAVLAALSSYRTHIVSRNHAAFLAMIAVVNDADPDDPDLFESVEELEGTRLEFTLRLVGDNRDMRPRITHPTDVLTHWEDLAPQLALDGASVYHDAAWRDEMRNAYKRGVLRGLNERCSGLVTAWDFPADLAIVLQHVDSLEGPGWYRHRDEGERAIFFEGWVRDNGLRDPTEETAARRARTADEIIDRTVGLGEEYEIAGGWACGEKGNEATCVQPVTRRERGV